MVVAVPVLADIGLVKDVTTADAGHPTSDVTLGGVGTPGYGAPEQLVRGEVSFASDIHALGVLADRCFNGNPSHACVITGNFENVVLPQKHLTASTGFLLYYCRIVLGGKQMSTKCRYCGSVSYGSGCYHSPTGKHEHRDDEKHCEYCGSSSYGSGCYHSPTKKHRHGPGGNKCIWCGSTSNGSGCYHSPTGKHEK